jgi:hypothetical protein
MTTPASGPISMKDVNDETNFSMSLFNFFNLSKLGGNGAVQYHNVEMGPSNNQTAKEMIYDPASLGASGENLKLQNWYNYTQDINGRFNITLTNNCSDNDVYADLYIGDPYDSPITYFPLWGPDNGPNGGNTRYSLSFSNGSDFSQINVDIGVSMSAVNFPSGVYTIYADFSAQFYPPPPPPPPTPPPPPPPPTTVSGSGSSSDTDNVGAGTSRTLNSGSINFDAGNPLSKIAIVTGDIPGGTGIGIFVNKRTTFSITFTS